MARPAEDLAAQLRPGNYTPDYAGEQVNRGAEEVLARQSAGTGLRGSRPIMRKVEAQDANYVEPGPAPFQCGNCSQIVWGTSRTGKDARAPDPSDDIDLCQIVEGPHDHGGITPEGSCRFWRPKPQVDRFAEYDRGPKEPDDDDEGGPGRDSE